MSVILTFLILIFGFVFIFFWLKRELKSLKEKENLSVFQLTQENLEKIHQALHLWEEKFARHLEKLIEESAKTSENVKILQEYTSEIENFKNILLGPKERGFFGEVLLEEILSRLPNNLVLKQYAINGYQRVDYALKIEDSIIPIDAKFPLENYLKLNNDPEAKRNLIKNLKEKIKSINQKYIQPASGSVEFAILYLPNEGLYYELFQDLSYQEVWDFAKENSVIIASPKIFEHLVGILFLTLRKTLLREEIDHIIKILAQIEKDTETLKAQFVKSEKQLTDGLKNLQIFKHSLNKFISNISSAIRLKTRH
jgi:DNA recombination protein RmuC